MNEPICENILMAKWARLDGEETEISVSEINSHLSSCENCRREFEQVKTLHEFMQMQTRGEQTADLWQTIERKIDEQTILQISPKPFLIVGILLAAYKLFEMLPARDFGLMFKLAPLVLIVALFIFIKENPFKINAQLTAPEK